MDEIRSWVEDSPYSKFLGVRLDHLDDESARLILPYQDENSNPGKALHGGCAASLGAIGGQAVARAALGPESGPWHTAQMQVSYLAAAIGEDVIAEAELLRRGKELCFVSIGVKTQEGKHAGRPNLALQDAVVQQRHRGRQFHGDAVAASGEKASQPSDGDSDEHRGSRDVSQLPQRNVLDSRNQAHRHGSAKHPAVQCLPAVPEGIPRCSAMSRVLEP